MSPPKRRRCEPGTGSRSGGAVKMRPCAPRSDSTPCKPAFSVAPFLMHIAVPYQLLVGLLQICKRTPLRTPEPRLTYLLSSILHPHCLPLSLSLASPLILSILTYP